MIARLLWPGEKVCVCVRVCMRARVSACLCSHPRAQQRHRVCSVIIKSLAGVQRRYEYDCNLSPPMMEHLSHAQMSACLGQPIERAHGFKFKRFSPSNPTPSLRVPQHMTASMYRPFFNLISLPCALADKSSVKVVFTYYEILGIKGTDLHLKGDFEV